MPAKARPSSRPIARPPAGGQAAPSQDTLLRFEQESLVIENLLLPAQLRTIIEGEKMGVGVTGVRTYLAKLTAGVKDPIEKMLVREFAVAHERLMQLHLSASRATAVEAVRVFNAAAARLQAELRRLALAIRQYRSPVTPKQFTAIGQQNIAHQQEVKLVQHAGQDEKHSCRDIELNGNGATHGDDQDIIPIEEPQPGAGRLREPQEVAGLHAGGA